MALNETVCGNEVKVFIENLTPEQKSDPNFVKILWCGIYEIVFNHFKNNAEIYDVVVDLETGEQIGSAKIK